MYPRQFLICHSHFSGQTKLYIEDWIGLRTLDEAGRVKYINVSGGHLGISKSDMKKHVVPYLIDPEKSCERKQAEPELEDKLSSKMVLEGSSSYNWPSSIKSFLAELLGLSDDTTDP